MKSDVLIKLAASGLVLGVCAVGCKPAGDARPMAASAGQPRADRAAARAAGRAEAKLARHKPAVADAERAVALAPRDARYRMILGQAYLAEGRFASAEAALAEAVTLDPEAGRARLSLALAQTANGRIAAARETLAAAQGRIPEADRGLALALAGDAAGAVPVLEAAARTPGATPRTRQNLALAYALAGEWVKAQAVASQDLIRADVDARIREWAAMARSGAPQQQVAAMLKITPAADPGMPTRLALAPELPLVPARAEPVRSAAAEKAPVEPAPAEPAVAAFTPAEAAPAVALTPAEAAPARVVTIALPAPAPVIAAPAFAPALIRAPAGLTRVAYARQVAPLVAAAQPAAPFQRPQGRWVVQLGAFSGATPLDAAWSRMASRVKLLSAYAPSHARVTHASGAFTRLSIGGFASAGEATRLCARIRAAGSPCFVRAAAGEAPVQMVAKRTEQLAAR